MHSANFRPLDMGAAIMAGLITPKPLCFLHAAAADLNWGELVSIPLGILKPTPLASALSCTVGEGKVWIPWERMHCA